jgi:acyl-CoA thioesterase FadM
MSSANAFARADIEASTATFGEAHLRVRFQDVDAAGTLFFPKVFELFADVYLQILFDAGLDVPGALRAREFAAPLAHVEADFVRPLFFGDAIQVRVARALVGDTSVRFGFGVWKDGQLAAYGSTVHVFVDGKTFQKCPVPAPLRDYLEGKAKAGT